MPPGFLDEGETLAERRAVELADACRILGVARAEQLGYGDSGMAGEASNDDPAAFARADVDEAAGRLAAILVEEGADVLVTYDEHGNYGHPDHIMVHTVGMRAAELHGTDRVYMVTQNRDFLRSMMSEADTLGLEIPADRVAALETLGEPAERITTRVDVGAHIAAKEAAMRAHASQIGETSFFLSMPPEVFATVWGSEWYVRMKGGPGKPAEDGREAGLLA